MITLPTTELVGCLTDVLPQIADPKGALAGVVIEWDGEALNFAAYDTYSGATVRWVPGDGAEGDVPEGDEMHDDDIDWGGEDEPWRVFIWLPQAKEILKLFKLPAKLWRFPVTLKCSPTGDRLFVEREDGPRVGRLLMVQTDNGVLPKIPGVRAIADQVGDEYSTPLNDVSFANTRLGAFGAVRFHGAMRLTFGIVGDPVAVHMGSRFAGFIYPQGATPRRYSVLRDGAGFMPGQTSGGTSV